MRRVDSHPDGGGTASGDEMAKVLDMARALGLHGIILLGRECPHCGGVHHFAVASSLDDSEDVARVLGQYAALCGQTPPTHRIDAGQN